MKRNENRNTVYRRFVVVFIFLPLFLTLFGSNTTLASPSSVYLQPEEAPDDQVIDPCDLLPPGGKISSQSDTSCMAQYASEGNEKVVAIQLPSIYEVATESLCASLLEPNDYQVLMQEVDFGDCGIQAEISYKGKPAPGYTGWRIMYFYEGFLVRVRTSHDYPAHKGWIYDTAAAIEKTIQNALGTTPPLTDGRKGWTKSEEECASMRQYVANQAPYAHNDAVDALKNGNVGIVTVSKGEVVQEYCDGGERSLSVNEWVTIGDCIRTGPNGRTQIILADRDIQRQTDSTVINIGRNSVLCFDRFDVSIEATHLANRETWMDLITGAIRVFFEGGPNTSVSVKTGITVCGVRGSEVLIQYLPYEDFVHAAVIEGHMDVTSEVTGETINLIDNQGTVVVEGDIMDTANISQERWESYLEEYGLRDADFPDVEMDDGEIIGEDPPNPGDGDDGKSSTPSPESQSLPINLALISSLCASLLCVVVFIAIIVSVVLVVRKRSIS